MLLLFVSVLLSIVTTSLEEELGCVLLVFVSILFSIVSIVATSLGEKVVYMFLLFVSVLLSIVTISLGEELVCMLLVFVSILLSIVITSLGYKSWSICFSCLFPSCLAL